MKKIQSLLILSILVTAKIQAQIVYSPNTYYLIPPTSGCNGIWAVQYPPNCIATTSIINPFGCATINHFNGDTLFFDLCSIPCEFLVVNDSGIICMNCLVFQQTTNVIENPANVGNVTVYPNPFNDKIEVGNENNIQSEIILFDITSRKMLQQKFINSVTLNTEQLAKGLYLYEVRSKDGSCKKGKVVKD
ncbi:MAG TPA: T9SS type A sorting domain-containing protein [Bacteroidia bacterium]|nr:T9SS type A sorting domain-containing protein [Bacteroidia bacterium]